MSRDLDAYLNQLAGGGINVIEGAIQGTTFVEYIQVTEGKRLVIYLMNFYYRQTGAATGGVTLLLDDRDDAAGADPTDPSATPIANDMFSNYVKPLLINLRACPIIGAVNKSLYMRGHSATAAHRPGYYIWYDEIP